MIEANAIEFINYWVDKYSKLVRDNEKLRIAMNEQLDEINTLRGTAMEWEHQYYHIKEKLEAERKDKERIIQTNQNLCDKINELKEKLDE